MRSKRRRPHVETQGPGHDGQRLVVPLQRDPPGMRVRAGFPGPQRVVVLAQLLAGAQSDPHLADATRATLQLWITPIEQTLARLLAGSPLAELLDTAGLARAVSAAFIGLELFEGVDPDGAVAALEAVERITVLAEVVDDLGPVARRTLRAKLRRRDGASPP